VGFVRTLSDGRIEIEAQGEADKIEGLLAWCQEEPHGSQIKNILYRHEEPVSHYKEFSVR
jgi:acylphosphatase